MDEEYNGWTNYETWCVNLWLRNDETLYAESRSIVAYACSEIDEPNYSFESLTESRTYEAAQKLERYVDALAEMTCPGCREGASFVSDLLSEALSEVDWREIAGNLVDEWEESEEAEPELI
jgi:hypothetical protein